MFWLSMRRRICQILSVRLYTRYRPTRVRHRPWRLWLALALLSAGLYGWLRWQPRAPERPQEVLQRAAESRAEATPPPPPVPVSSNTEDKARANTVASKSESPPSIARGIETPTRNLSPDAPGIQSPGRPVDNLFEAQLALARIGFSPGSLDAVIGSRTRNALRMFQQREQLRVTGELDPATKMRLKLEDPPYTTYTVTREDLARLLPVGSGWVAKSEQARLDYSSILELVAERSWSHPDYVRRVNPQVDWGRVEAGTPLLVPNIGRPEVKGKASMIRIQLGNRFLQVFDDRFKLIAHFPCTVARSVDRRPLGELRVEVLIPMPNYTFDPNRFARTAETRGIENKLILPPGPNNPVGTVWIGLNRNGYGIHGTPEPEKVGGAESLGCFRLANWNAEHLVKLAWVGMPVHVEP